MNGIKNFYDKYKHGIPMAIYSVIYLLWFRYLETQGPKMFDIIHMDIDDSIPFCEVFIIPYLFWFVYMIGVIVYFMCTNKEDYHKAFIFLTTGMTVFLLVSTFFPNGQRLRPVTFERDNIFTAMVGALYRTDTPTNLWPSIHCYNSLGAHFAIINSKQFRNNMKVRLASLITCVLIIMSTMFLKQHSVFDVLTAFALAAIMYAVCYKPEMINSLFHSPAGSGKKHPKSQAA